MFEIFQYTFVVRGLVAGLIIGVIAPLVGIFLVLRRYSLIADTLAHVSLAGVAIGLLTGLNPLLTALGASALSSLAIERLRNSKKIYGETALSIFLSGSLALAVVLIGLSHGFNVDLFSYLFGSILTVRPQDIFIMILLALIIGILFILFFRELIYLSFDEDSAKVSGIPASIFNSAFILLSAATIAISIPIIGVLLISALLVLPVITALQFRRSFAYTLLYAEIISLSSIMVGIIGSFYLNIPSGGFIVLVMLAIFIVTFLIKKPKSRLMSW
ncbi:MAG: metal ABC transporter permease [Patescibacteria group bacterium]|jgi:zinc transport system permease protein